MTERVATEAEVGALLGEAIGNLETIAHAATPLDKQTARSTMASLRIKRARLLADRNP